MKKRLVAFICIVVLLLWPLAGCKKPNDPASDESFAGMQEDNEQLFLPEISVENTEENVDPEDVLAKNEDVVENEDINIKENNADQPTDIEDPTSSELTEKPMDKIYTTPTLEETFVPGEVLVLLTYAASDFYEGLSADSFSCVEYLSVEWSNPCTPETVETLANPSMYRQRYHIVLKEQTKQAVLDAIKELEKLDFVYCAEPNYTYTFDIPEDAISEQRTLSPLGDTSVASSNGGYYPAAYTNQYAIEKMSLPAAWHISTGKSGTIKVGF